MVVVENNNSNQWADDKVEGLRKLKEKLTSQLAELTRSKHSNREEILQAEISGLEMKIRYDSEQLAGLNSVLTGRQSELVHIGTQLKELKPQINQLTTKIQEIEQRTSALQSQVSSSEDRIFGNFVLAIGVADIREYERTQSGLLNELAQKRSAFATQISRLKNQLQFENERLQDTGSRINSLKGRSRKRYDPVRSVGGRV